MTFDSIPVFDSLAHPVAKGIWFGKEVGNTFKALQVDLLANNIIGACAVSLPPMSDEELLLFYQSCIEESEAILYPVAAINFTEQDFKKKISLIKNIGFKAVKIHPRLSGLNMESDFEKIAEVFRLCQQHELIVFFCTYYHTSIINTPEMPLIFYITRLLKQAPELKLILLHGGDVSLMQFAQLARFNPNILIDLSYTFIKFAGSSVDSDIKYLMNNFEKRICIGSDYPDFSMQLFRNELERIAGHVDDKRKLERLFSGNLMDFLEISQ